MGHVVVIETTQHVDYCIAGAYVAKELVAETLTFTGAFHQTGYIDNLNRGGHHAGGVLDFNQFVEPLIGYGYHTNVGLNGAEREVCGLRLGVAQAVKES